MRDDGVRVLVPFPNTFGECLVCIQSPYVMFAPIVTLLFYGPDLAHGDDFSFKVALLAYLCGVLTILSAVGAIIAVWKVIPSLFLPLLTFLTLDVFIGFFSICSLFVRTPPCLRFIDYLNWRWPPNALYMYGKDGVIHRLLGEEHMGTKEAISIVLLLLIKLYLVMCCLRVYKGRWKERQGHVSTVKLPEKGLLPPSNEEAVALPDKEPPPPASSG